ncbi:hypothetical protein QYF36_007848 [Acer negundo]|nr:hypothetical protein QYF36_007848 [Acer negundo]
MGDVGVGNISLMEYILDIKEILLKCKPRLSVNFISRSSNAAADFLAKQGNDGQHLHQSYGHGYADGSKGPLSWQEVLETCNTSSVVESQEKQLSSFGREMAEKQEHSPWPNFNGSHVEHSTMLLPQEVNIFKSHACSSVIGTHETNSDYNTMFFDQDQIGVPLEGDLSLAVTQKFLFRSFRMVSSVAKHLLVLLENGTSSGTIEWLMQELLKDKLQQWLSSKSMGESDQPDCSLSKKERGIVHMIAGLGFEWALNPILSHGVNVNFWDINGWTALHWASRFGRH